MKGQHGAHRAQLGCSRWRAGHQAAPGLGGWLSGDSVHAAVTEALQAPGKIPGCSGTRNLHDNLSDLRAQVAANQKGIQLVGELIGQYGLDVVQAYMGHIQVGLGHKQGGSSVPAQGSWGGGCLPHPGGGTAASQHSPRQANAELAVRDMLRAFGSSRQARGLPLEVSAEDHMDDGSPIRLRVHINLSQVRLPQQGPGGGASVAWPPYR